MLSLRYLLSQTVELAAKSKELIAATSKREQLEVLLEKTEGSQITSADLQKQVLTFKPVSVDADLMIAS